MKKDMFRKGWVVSVIILLIGINIAPIVNANFNRILPMTKKSREVDEGGFVEVTCQFRTFKGVSKVVKTIPLTSIKKISTLAQNVYSGIETNLHPKIIKERIITLVDELKNNEMIPSICNSKKVATLLMNYLIISQKLSILFQDVKIKADAFPHGTMGICSYHINHFHI